MEIAFMSVVVVELLPPGNSGLERKNDMRKRTSNLMLIGIAALSLGSFQRLAAQIPVCPPFCQAKAESKTPPKAKEPVKVNQQKKHKKTKKEAIAA
jgi:hypothetical protein